MTTRRLAHRGDHRRLPENSLAALVAGARAPMSDGVEFDVRVSADGVPVVIHDDTLERVQGVTAVVADTAAAELARHGVPSLADVLAALPPSAFLDVELKVVPGPEVAPRPHRGARPGPGRRRRLVVPPGGTRGPRRDRTRLGPLGQRAVGRRGASWAWRGTWAAAASPPPTAPSTAAPRASSSAAGLDLAAWTVTRRPTFERLARLGVAAVCVEGSLLDR